MITVMIIRYSEEMDRSLGFKTWQPETNFFEAPILYKGAYLLQP